MSASVLYMSMSLDGYIAGPNDEPGNPGGDRFMRLHEWYGDFTPPSGPEPAGPAGPAGEFLDEIKRPVRCWRADGPWSRLITGAAIITVSRSSCPATGRPTCPW